MFVEHKEQGEVTEAPAKLDKDSEALLRAAAYIEEHGWCQHTMRAHGGRVCMVGAVEEVTGESCSSAWTKLQDAMEGACGHWNDAPGRTVAEAVAKLRAIALGL